MNLETIAVTQIRIAFGTGPGQLGQIEADRLLEGVGTAVRQVVERCGGTFAATIGEVSLLLFDQHEEPGRNAERAVLAALEVRDLLSPPRRGAHDPLVPVGVEFSGVVCTGEAVVRRQVIGETLLPYVAGDPLERCQRLLPTTGPGDVVVCDDTRHATRLTISYEAVSGSCSEQWRALGPAQAARPRSAAGRPELDRELKVLAGLLERARSRSRPHLVTLLGGSTSGKSRLLDEFGRMVAGGNGSCRVLSARVPLAAEDEITAIVGQLLGPYAGAGPAASASVGPGPQRGDRPSPRLVAATATGDAAAYETILHAWHEFLRLAASQDALVITVDDLHRASDVTLDFVEELADSFGHAPVLAIVAARSELLRRRPVWRGGKPNATTLTLD